MSRWLRITLVTAGLVTAGLWTSCSVPSGPGSSTADPSAPGLVVRDCQGEQHAPLDVSGDKVHVVVFISHECPIANGYAPTLGELYEQWAKEPRVEMFLVHVDPDFDAAAAVAHQKDYQLPGPVLMDPGQVVAKACGATITPEAVVVTAGGIAYRGRIDDQWRKLGSRAPQASQRDLADAVANVLQGKAVATPFPKAVGCLLPEPRK